MAKERRYLSAVILDVDGVIWISGALGEGSADILASLSRHGIDFCLLTNDCTVSKASRHATLTQAGLLLRPDQLVTASEVTNDWLKDAGAQRIMYLGAPSALPDVAADLIVAEGGPVDAVVVGDLFDHYDRETIDRAAKAVVRGAQLVAIQRNRRWSDGRDWYVDNGFWVAGFEYVTDRHAVVTGKPSASAYLTALQRLGVSPVDRSEVAIVSDDVATDLMGGKAMGLTTVYCGPSRDLADWVDLHVDDVGGLSSIVRGCRDA